MTGARRAWPVALAVALIACAAASVFIGARPTVPAEVLAVLRVWDFGEDDRQRLNVHGSGISLGHPVGATGMRILATMSRELDRREGRYALETMCLGGGQGLAAAFERVA